MNLTSTRKRPSGPYLHLRLLRVGVDDGRHVTQSGLPGLAVQQNTVQNLEKLLLKCILKGKEKKLKLHFKNYSFLT